MYVISICTTITDLRQYKLGPKSYHTSCMYICTYIYYIMVKVGDKQWRRINNNNNKMKKMMMMIKKTHNYGDFYF